MWSRRQFKASITSCHILGSSCTIIRYFKNTRSILTSSYCVTLRVEALPKRVVVLIELLRFVGAMWTFRSRSLVKDQITKINIFSISCFLLRKISVTTFNFVSMVSEQKIKQRTRKTTRVF